MKPTVSIVIPHRNNVDQLQKHLPLVMDRSSGAEIIVVDDASNVGSVGYLKKEFPNVRFVMKASHSGFSSTVNRGVKEASGDVVVLMNTDVIPEAGFLDPLIQWFNDPKVFAVGCLEKSHENGKIVLRGRGVAGWVNGFYIHRRGEVDQSDTAWVSGGSSAFKRELFVRLGGMDELMNPFYWEDIDLSYRARKAGLTIGFETKSIVDHFHEEGTISTQFSKHEVKQTAYRNQFIFIWKNLTDPFILIQHLVWLPVRIVQAIIRGDGSFIIGLTAALLRIPKIMARRNKVKQFWKKPDREL